MGRPGEGVEPLRGDRAAASHAAAVRSVVEPGDGRLDEREVLGVVVAQGEVALLLEDLARGRRLRPVRHWARRDDRLGDLGADALALGDEGLPRVVEKGVAHRRIVPDRHLTYTPGEYLEELFTMAIEKDPVCGMEVDTSTSDLKLEHDGTTYWFCGKGCLLEFRDDPERFLDPDYVPSM